MKNLKTNFRFIVPVFVIILIVIFVLFFNNKKNLNNNLATVYNAVTTPILPTAYFEFENPDPKQQVAGYGISNIIPETPTANIPVSVVDGAIGQYASLTDVGGLLYKIGRTDSFFSPSNAVIEFAMKPKQWTHDINLFNSQDNSVAIWIESKYTESSITTITFSVNTNIGLQKLSLDFDSINQKSLSSIFDDNWHTFVFKFNNGNQEIWIDGMLLASKNASSTLSLGVNKNLILNNGNGQSHRNFSGAIDSLRTYDVDVPGNLIYEHYQNLKNGILFNDTTNVTLVPDFNNQLSYDPKQYLPNAILPNPSSNKRNQFTDYSQTPVSVVDQLKDSPLPRYKQGNILGRNINVSEISYLSHTNPNNYAAEKYAPKSSVDTAVSIVSELANNWNYYLDITNTNAGGIQPVEIKTSPNCTGNCYSFMGNILAYADLHPELPTAITTNRNHLVVNACGGGNCIGSYQNHPADSYLQNSAGQFLDRLGNISNVKKWRPTSNANLYNPDGIQQKSALAQIVTKLPNRDPSKTIDLIWDNGEVLYRLADGVVVNTDINKMDPDLNSAYLASPFNGVAKGIQKFIAKLYAEEETNSYVNHILSIPQLSNSQYSMYAQDGWDLSTRFHWDEAKKLLTPRNGQYYATTELYTRYPWNWSSASGADNGLHYASYAINTQIKSGDNFYSPFISPGWNINTTKNITPGQWLGLLKNYTNTGAEYFYTGYFNRADKTECADGLDNDADGQIDLADGNCITNGKDNDESGSAYNSPDGYPATKIWQNMIPSYAQAIFSKIDNLYKNSTLLEGDMKWDPNDFGANPIPLYGFLSGDPQKWITVRKVNGKSQYIISGNINRVSNLLNSVPAKSKATINLAGQKISFDVRPEGSVYFLDLTNTNAPVFYQLDGWHEDAHPYNWTSDFDFEAELFDTGNSSVKTEGFGISSMDFSGDFYDSFINPSQGESIYNFNPRNDQPEKYYLWYKSKSNSSVSSAKVKLDSANEISLFSNSSSMSWCNKDENNNVIGFDNVLPNTNHEFKFIGNDSNFYFDKFILTKDANLNLGNCNKVIVTSSGGGGGGGGSYTPPIDPIIPTIPVIEPDVSVDLYTSLDALLKSSGQILPIKSKTMLFNKRGITVSVLQAYLANNPLIYKEGLVTGYFGPLTRKAVIAFQSKYDLPTVIFGKKFYDGIVGPKTMAKINELYKKDKGTDLFEYIK